MSWVSSISLVLCTTSFRRHRYPFSTVPTKRLLKCLLMDSTSTKEERRPVGTGNSGCKSLNENISKAGPCLQKIMSNSKAGKAIFVLSTGKVLREAGWLTANRSSKRETR